MKLDFWTMFEVVGLIYVITGKLIFSDDFETEDWIKLMADARIVALLKKLFGEEDG